VNKPIGTLAIALFSSAILSACALPVHEIKLPPGFEINLYATGVDGARAMALGDGGTVFVGTYKTGKVYAVAPPCNGQPARVTVIAQELQDPHGVAYRDGALYVAERSRILRFDTIEQNLERPPPPVIVYDQLPRYAHHGLRTIHFGPDGMLYVPIGAPCNICLPEVDRYAVLTRLDLASGKQHVFARGIRNTVGYDWHPETQELWFTDNGRDLLGNETPPDELNYAPRPGMHFGYPYCHAGELSDPEFGLRHPCTEFIPPVQKLGPHVAALGMRFYTGDQFPPEYRRRIFIAEHGSWNRSPKSGYRITMVTLRDSEPTKYESFAEGWLSGNSVWGRPVDVLVGTDGSLLVSDDKNGVLYRIAYRGR
jgi:glucose/arabinose dehydrogenase